MKLTRRGSMFELRRRVPSRYARIEPRRVFWTTLKTDSESEAMRKAAEVWDRMIAGWEAHLSGDSGSAEQRYEAARDLAHAKGFKFLSVNRVAALPVDDLLDRIEATRRHDGATDTVLAAAILGGAAKPEITVSRALEIYFDVADDKNHGKSADQIRRWRNPRIKAFRNFIEVVGDMPVGDITGDDMLNFRQWWWERIRDENLTANSANKDLIHFCGVVRHINRIKRMGLSLPFSDLSFEQETSTRIPFSDDWIAEKIIKNPALANLNTEARVILLGMINTGYRPSEPINLGSDQIRLDHKIPHLSIEPIGRKLKTAYSKRIIPLTGISLEAFRLCPNGLPRYFDTAGASNTINKFMRENGMMETDGHSLYGLRHSFEDRMLAACVDERIRRDLMGHALNRERYGKGATLEAMHAILHSIAL